MPWHPRFDILRGSVTYISMLHTDIKEKIKDAMRAKDALRLEVLRGMTTAFVNELVALRRTPQDVLEDDKALAVVKRLVKQRKDSHEQFTSGGRPELAAKEAAELEILGEFLPAMMSQDAIRVIAEKKKAELGVTDKSGMGKLMGAIIKETGGAADGADVKAIVESLFA
jgi:uncharacterized protein YqeY